MFIEIIYHHTTPTLSGDVTPAIYFRHPVDFLLDEQPQFRWCDDLHLGAVAEDDLDQLAEIGGREFEQEATVRVEGGLLLRVPDLFGQPGCDFWGKAQGYRMTCVALHDAEMAAGIFLDGREIGGEGESPVGWFDPADAGQGKIAEGLPGRAPGHQKPAAHIVHEMQGLDGSLRGSVGMGRVVGDVQRLLGKEGHDGMPEGRCIDFRVFDVFYRDFLGYPVQASAAVSAGYAGHPVDQPAELVLQGRVRDGRGQPDGEGQGKDIGLTDPVAGQFVGVVGISESAPGVVIEKRRIQVYPHEIDIAIGGSPGNLEFFPQVPGIGKFSGLDPAMEPEKTLVSQLIRHIPPPMVDRDGLCFRNNPVKKSCDVRVLCLSEN